MIDCVLDDRISAALVATEAESDVRRLEQQIRWAREKAASVQSADLWPFVTEGRNEPPRVSRLLLLRSTRRSRLLAHTLRATFEAAYPADAGAVRAALTTANAPWPGDGLLWVRIDGAETRILDRRPPGVPGP